MKINDFITICNKEIIITLNKVQNSRDKYMGPKHETDYWIQTSLQVIQMRVNEANDTKGEIYCDVTQS